MDYLVTEIEDYIELVRDAVPNSVEVFTRGNCTSFALMLERTFPGGEVLHNLDHAVYKYKNSCYDITGSVAQPKGARPIQQFGISEIRQLLKNNYEN